MLKTTIFLIGIIFITSCASTCTKEKDCHSTEYQTYVKCLEDRTENTRNKRSTPCDKQANSCDDSCDCDNCSESNSNCCSSCCNFSSCEDVHCCHTVCHSDCKTSSCRRKCRQNCVKTVDTKNETSTTYNTVNNNYNISLISEIIKDLINQTAASPSRNVTTIINLNNVVQGAPQGPTYVPQQNPNVFAIFNTHNTSTTYYNRSSTSYNPPGPGIPPPGYPPVGPGPKPSQPPLSPGDPGVTNTPTPPSRAPQCCKVFLPTQCQSYYCYNPVENYCGPQCIAPVIHVVMRQPCQQQQQGCNVVIPQPSGGCQPQQTWPYVGCGGQSTQMSCGGCYDSYRTSMCQAGCYGNMFNGPMYQPGPISPYMSYMGYQNLQYFAPLPPSVQQNASNQPTLESNTPIQERSIPEQNYYPQNYYPQPQYPYNPYQQAYPYPMQQYQPYQNMMYPQMGYPMNQPYYGDAMPATQPLNLEYQREKRVPKIETKQTIVIHGGEKNAPLTKNSTSAALLKNLTPFKNLTLKNSSLKSSTSKKPSLTTLKPTFKEQPVNTNNKILEKFSKIKESIKKI